MEIPKSRTYNSISNSIYGILCSAITIILNFFVRITLVRELGEEINGLHNLFQSITSVMLLMELGINSAMIIHLYAPLTNKDVELIKGIIALYKKAYSFLAIIFTTVSILISLFLVDTIVSSSLPLLTVQTYFVLFTLSFTADFLTQYKRSILFAEQKNRISVGITAICEIFFRTLQIALLIVWHQYIIFLTITIIEKLTSNFIAIRYVEKHHPYLKEKLQQPLTTEKRVAIFNTVKPLMVNQVASTAQNAANGILISLLLGNVAIVGYYGNYQLIISIIYMVYSQFGGAFTTSFGNLAVDATTEHRREVYIKSAFIMNWVAAILCAGFIAVVQDFIFLVFGPNFVINMSSVLVLALNTMIYLINIPVISIQNAMGLHNLDAKWMIVQAVMAIGLGYVGGVYWSMTGIFVGLLIPLVIFTYIHKGIVICKSALKMKSTDYLIFICKATLMISISIILSIWFTGCIHIKASVMSIFVKGLIAVFIGTCVPLILSFNTEEFKQTMNLVTRFIYKK